MIALFDFIPQFCPQCGEKFFISGTGAADDYQAGASFQCHGCGLLHGFALRADLLTAADGYRSDMRRQLEGE